jgi:hypothetical protein
MKDKIQSKIIRLDDEMQKIINDFADALSSYISEAKTEEELECFRKFRDVLERLKEL